jgi:hypothetical protein
MAKIGVFVPFSAAYASQSRTETESILGALYLALFSLFSFCGCRGEALCAVHLRAAYAAFRVPCLPPAAVAPALAVLLRAAGCGLHVN